MQLDGWYCYTVIFQEGSRNSALSCAAGHVTGCIFAKLRKCCKRINPVGIALTADRAKHMELCRSESEFIMKASGYCSFAIFHAGGNFGKQNIILCKIGESCFHFIIFLYRSCVDFSALCYCWHWNEGHLNTTAESGILSLLGVNITNVAKRCQPPAEIIFSRHAEQFDKSGFDFTRCTFDGTSSHYSGLPLHIASLYRSLRAPGAAVPVRSAYPYQ